MIQTYNQKFSTPFALNGLSPGIEKQNVFFSTNYCPLTVLNAYVEMENNQLSYLLKKKCCKKYKTDKRCSSCPKKK